MPKKFDAGHTRCMSMEEIRRPKYTLHVNGRNSMPEDDNGTHVDAWLTLCMSMEEVSLPDIHIACQWKLDIHFVRQREIRFLSMENPMPDRHVLGQRKKFDAWKTFMLLCEYIGKCEHSIQSMNVPTMFFDTWDIHAFIFMVYMHEKTSIEIWLGSADIT